MSDSKTCPYCSKPLKNVDEKFVLHEKCFERYKNDPKTKENYIFLIGKYRGKTYEIVKKNHSKYLKWVEKQDFEDDSPMYFLQMYVKKFNKDEDEPAKKDKKKDKKEKKKNDVLEEEDEDEEHVLNV